MKRHAPSATATLVAMGTVMAHRDGLTPSCPHAAQIALRCLSVTWRGRRLRDSVRSSAGRALWRWIERGVSPGLIHHWARRKAWIARAVDQHLARGPAQLVVVGAGCDALASRIASGAVPAVELDHPATQSVKRDALRRLPGPAPRLLAADLAHDDLGERLRAGDAIDPALPVVVVIEGVLMYLPEAAVQRVLRSVAGLPVPEVILIATFMDVHEGVVRFRPSSPWARRWLRRVREPFLFGIHADKLPGFLASCGLSLDCSVDGAELARIWPGQRIDGEVLVSCRARR